MNTLSYQPHFIVAIILSIVFIIAAIVSWIIFAAIPRHDQGRSGFWWTAGDFISWWVALWTSIGAVIVLGICAGLFVPYNSYFYYNYTKTGVVTEAYDYDQYGDYLVKIDTYKHEVYVDDTRIHKDLGKTVTLFCTPQFQWNSQPYMVCNIDN